MRLRLLLIVLVLCSAYSARATHVMGGEITWKCSGNGYIFELIFYRDCNGVEVNTISENIEVWNHPTVSNILVAFISRQDISPTCSPVPGSPPALDCGSGASGGNGIGAIEKITYRSAVILLPGNPPAGTGWIFTYDNFSRSNLITNLQNPDNYGLTITAKMFPIPGAAGGVCIDNSPQFLQDPYLVSCSGENYSYNMHPVDVDLDSLHMAFGIPMNNFSGVYNPPISPDPVPYEIGFSSTNPTPDASFQAGNIPAQIDPLSGELTFSSSTIGSFVVKVVTQSFRKGILIAEVEREMQLIVLNCTGNNTAPVITPPFAGLFETTVDAGTLVTFNLTSTDVEVLQDGSPQNNILTSTGLLYGTNFTSTSGCAVGPCATLNQTPAIIGIQGATTQFSWQTDCDHVVTAYGDVAEMIPYHFVFKVQDNYCQIPKITYRTVTINVRNPGIIPATSINCITTAPNGDVTVNWDAVADPDGTFVEYQLHSVQNGLLGTYPIATTSAVVPFPGAAHDFFVNVISGCNGNATTTSDTIQNVFLDVSNPSDGTAILQWNSPTVTPLPGMNPNITIWREYPAGVWTILTTVPYGSTFYKDTIDICSTYLNYMVVYETPTCQYNSNIDGDDFEDMITPDLPIITSVSIDTLTGNPVITWNVNNQPDTYGYVIYQQDVNGFVVEIDTVWGINNTTYIHNTAVDGPMTYSVAAFDSCFTIAVPPTYQTSAKAALHSSVFLTRAVNVCDNTVSLNWTDYVGWNADLQDYTIFMRENGGAWTNVQTVAGITKSLQLLPLSSYCFSIRANNTNGTEAFSNIICFTLTGPTPPATHYLRVATIDANEVILRHEITTGSNVASIRFEKFNIRNGLFEELAVVDASSNTLTLVDSDVDVNSFSYRYRAVVIDSCGNEGTISNEANTILLTIATDQVRLINYLNWSAYTKFDGDVFRYYVYRGVDGNYDPNAIATLTSDHRFYEDDVTDYEEYTGRFCYKIIAQEGINNQYGFTESSVSNEVCAVIEPLVYIPNAFTPEGKNPIFKPILSFTDYTAFEMTILDRWGQKVFSTKDINLGWDGIHQLSNKLVDVGTYGYVVRILDGNDQELLYRGHVTVLR
jgi:gliding motility-associated-like protein